MGQTAILSFLYKVNEHQHEAQSDTHRHLTTFFIALVIADMVPDLRSGSWRQLWKALIYNTQHNLEETAAALPRG